MASFNIALQDIIQEASNTVSYVFSKPADFHFEPGQHVVIQVDAGTGKVQDGLRTFTMASSPTEDHLRFSMRESASPFKKKLASLKKGDEIIIRGPAGKFVLPQQ